MPRSAVGPLIASVVLIAVAGVILALSGASDEPQQVFAPAPTPTLGPEATVTPAAGATTATRQGNVAVPARPDAFADYAEAIAAYLSEAGEEALGPPCLAALLDAWQMPPGDELLHPHGVSGGERCVMGNTDTDAEDEIVVVLTAEESLGLLSDVTVFDRGTKGYDVTFQWRGLDGVHQPFISEIVSVGDITGDGAGELVYATNWCGASTCTLNVFVVAGRSGKYERLDTSADVPELPSDIAMATAEVRVEDTDGDGTMEIVLHGGIIQSAAAGPQRMRTEVYGWNGQLFSLTSSENDPSPLRYFKVRDADEAFSQGDYEQAAGLYQEAIDGTGLEEVTWLGSREELTAYSTFRLGLSYLKFGDTKAAAQQVNAAIANYPVSLHGKVAMAFRNAISLNQGGYSGQLSAGCDAVSDFASQNLDRFREVWDYGWANPDFEADALCPF